MAGVARFSLTMDQIRNFKVFSAFVTTVTTEPLVELSLNETFRANFLLPVSLTIGLYVAF